MVRSSMNELLNEALKVRVQTERPVRRQSQYGDRLLSFTAGQAGAREDPDLKDPVAELENVSETIFKAILDPRVGLGMSQILSHGQNPFLPAQSEEFRDATYRRSLSTTVQKTDEDTDEDNEEDIEENSRIPVSEGKNTSVNDDPWVGSG